MDKSAAAAAACFLPKKRRRGRRGASNYIWASRKCLIKPTKRAGEAKHAGGGAY